ncbi:uncharacterized protein LOC143694750 [Agelaius phoeniceus]|uniref:uncharacterized protein LOC143694750 n=1 Tax=Agelaius phoeniceus TaxID=39638 RepID=UPI0040553131
MAASRLPVAGGLQRDLEERLMKRQWMQFAERLRRPRARQPAPPTPLPGLGRAGRLGRCWARGTPGRGAQPAPSLSCRRSPQLLQDESRAAEQLRWALPRLLSPQRRVREAAVGIIGLAGVLVKGQKEELQILSEALQALREDESPSCLSILIQLTFERRSAGLCSSAGSDAPASIGDFQFPLKMRAPAEQDGPAGAPGTALAAQS